MTEPFGATYAGVYDVLYQEKDYEAECDVIGSLLQRYSTQPISSVLDLGCGTGNHVFPIARRGYSVLGVDRSEHMLGVAQRRLSDSGHHNQIAFRQGDIRDVQLGRRFDAALMMFAVLGYQVENSDVLAALTTARTHLEPGGLLVFDVWYGPAVLHQRPSDRIRVTHTEHERVLRAASGDLDVARHLCTVRFHLWRLAGDRLLGEVDESHLMRFFFPLELGLFLSTAGFELQRLGAFPAFDRDPDETTWNVLGVARAV